jgi:hypothetical protein
MKKRFATLLLGLLAAAGAYAQTVGNAVHVPLMSDRDNDSTGGTREYCVTTGAGGDALAPGLRVSIPVKTSGAATSITAVTAGTQPFKFVAVGDEVTFPTDGATPVGADKPRGGSVTRYVLTRADADNITINGSNIDLSLGYTFTYRKVACGTAATDGWVPTASFGDFEFSMQIDQSDASSVDVAIYCENFGAASAPTRVYQQTFTSPYGDPGGRVTYATNLHWDRCRVGITLGSDASDAGGNLEKLSVYFSGRRPATN